MNDDQTNGTLGGIIAFSVGALVGAGIALILAPQSGAEIRKIVRDYVAKAADELMARSQDARATVKTALDHGREAFEAAKEQGKDAYETGKEAMKGVGKEMKTRV
jgi:gas vesicle protein